MTHSMGASGPSGKRRLAIIGGGSAGLITLKTALELLPEWEIVCLERSDRTTGSWGHPYPGFVSTSTKYTTQFACFPQFDASVNADGGASREEFFRDGEYGEYLEAFAEHFQLKPHIRLQTEVMHLARDSSGNRWQLEMSCSDNQTTERFDQVIICTGLAAVPQSMECDVPTATVRQLHTESGLESIRDTRVVVVGGGESAVDYANRLARPELGNSVYLSLKSGIRVSPRYHPIRGVPSDFLRNRLLLSIHRDMRNWIGERFVRLRINHQECMEWWFGRKQPETSASTSAAERRKAWTARLTRAAKDDLFNMFHNKSDDFLHAVGEERITIVGPAIDRRFFTFRQFASDETVDIRPELVVPAIGYCPSFPRFAGESTHLSDFYLGCEHVEYDNLFLVGFARPVIGNIPSISEMQANYVCRRIAGSVPRSKNLHELHRQQQQTQRNCFASIDPDTIHSVEMIPYCDHLARLMGRFPTVRRAGSLRAWTRQQLSPSTTMHYFPDTDAPRQTCQSAPIYMPSVLVLLLLALKPVDLLFRILMRGTPK